MSDLVERLEPCPFCGGEAEACKIGSLHWHAYCDPENNCEAEPYVGGYPTEESAIAAWNRRAENPELTRLRSEVERLTTLTARTREVLAPFAAVTAGLSSITEDRLLRVHYDNGNYLGPLRPSELRAANTLFNELKEKDNG